MTQAMNIPSILAAIRSQLNLTQEQLAERLGVSFATVNRWEGGLTKPQKAALEVIAGLAREAQVDKDNAEIGAAAKVTRRRRGKSPLDGSTKPMEQMLWDAACS